jgi:hypothetical protein
MFYKPTAKDRKFFSKLRLVIISPIMHCEPRWVRSLVNMMAYSWMNDLKIYAMGITERVVVDWARNDLARIALHQKCNYTNKYYTHFLWLDSDHIFNPDLGVCLARHFMRADVDICSAVDYMRSGPTLPVVYVKDETPDEYLHYPLVIVPEILCEVDAVGFGACITKREVFKKTPKPWFTIDAKAGEDIAFCVAAKKAGFKVWVDGTYRLGHIGEPPVVTHKTYLEHMEKNKDVYADRVKINLDGGVKDARK